MTRWMTHPDRRPQHEDVSVENPLANRRPLVTVTLVRGHARSHVTIGDTYRPGRRDGVLRERREHLFDQFVGTRRFGRRPERAVQRKRGERHDRARLPTGLLERCGSDLVVVMRALVPTDILLESSSVPTLRTRGTWFWLLRSGDRVLRARSLSLFLRKSGRSSLSSTPT